MDTDVRDSATVERLGRQDTTMTARLLLTIIREAIAQSLTDRLPRMGAALAFYMTFSLAPTLLVVVAIAGAVFGRQAAEGRILNELKTMVGSDAAAMLQALISAAGQQGSGLLASLIAGITVFVGAIGYFCELQDTLNAVLQVQSKPGASSLWALVQSRLVSFLLVLAFGFLLLASLALSTAATIVSRMIDPTTHWMLANWFLTDLFPACVSFCVITILLGMIYRFLPNTRMSWRAVWFGSIASSILFAVGKSLLSLYLGQIAVASIYGAAASIIVLMIWNYYTAQIILFGAELMKAHERHLGMRVP